MKKIIFLLIAFLAIGNCAQAQKTMITPSATGIGVIKIGANVSKMPAKVNGLYDKITKEIIEHNADTFTRYQFTKNGTPVANVDDYAGDGEITTVEILSPDYTLAGIAAGTPIADVLKDKRFKQELLRDGTFYFFMGSITVEIEEFSKAGYKKLSDAYNKGKKVTFTLADFPANAKVKSLRCTGGL